MSEVNGWTPYSETGNGNEAFSPSPGHNRVFFHDVQKQNNHESKIQNRPVFRAVPHITILTPGDKDLVNVRPASQKDKDEYAQQWAQYLLKKEQTMPGTPIDLWPAIDETQKAELKALHIYTIDQMAGLDDGKAQKIMGFHDLRKKAKQFIDAASVSASASQLQEELRQRDVKIDELTAMVQRLLTERGAAPKRGRGRPPKKTSPETVAA